MSAASARRIVWPTLLTLAGLAILLGLGTWQLERRDWKHALIARAEGNSTADPVELPAAADWPDLARGDWEYRRVRLQGVFDHAAETYVFTSLGEPKGAFGGPGYFVLTPLALGEARSAFVNRGFVPVDRKDPATRPQGAVEGVQEVVGILRFSAPPGLFTPDPDVAAGDWYTPDIAGIAAARGIAGAAPFYVDAAASAPGGLPQGGETRLTFSDAHLSYALTWYGLAAALAVVYLAYLRASARRGRPD